MVFLIMAFIWARYYKEKGQKTLVAEYLLKSPQGQTIGKAQFWAQDQETILKVRLAAKPPEENYVLLYFKGGVGKTAGKIRGTVLVRSLGGLDLEELVALKLRGVKSGAIYGETKLSFERKE